MHGSTASLTCGEKPGNDHIRRVSDNLRLPVRRDPTHVVVHSRQHWSRLLGHINTCKDLCSLGDARKSLCQSLCRQMVQMQIDVILQRPDTTTLADLHCRCPAHNITRSKVLGCWCISGHERLSFTISQDSAFASAT